MKDDKQSGFWKGFKHAFAVEKKDEYEYTEADTVLLDKIAAKIKKFGMATPAILFLDSAKPLGYMGSQAMVFFRPIVHSMFSCHDYDHFRELLEHRSSIDELIKRIEIDDRKEDKSR